MAEHLKHAKEPAGRFISIINKTITESKVSHQLMCSLTHPIPKKNKPTNIPANALGISATPIVANILDSITLTHYKKAKDTTHVLQFSFTEGKSCLHAAILVTASITESKDTDTPLYIASLDIQKDFDVYVVSHPSMLHKLQVGDVTGLYGGC